MLLSSYFNTYYVLWFEYEINGKGDTKGDLKNLFLKVLKVLMCQL